jgi:carboxyl-terminal processing protease
MEENKKQKIYKIIMLIFVTALVTALITSVIVYNYAISGSLVKYINSSSETSDIEKSINKIKKIIDEHYLGDVDESKLKDGALKGYVEAVGDEYTEYYTKEEMDSFEEDTLGNFTGIGIYMVKDTENNVIKVLTPIDGTPAYNAGIQPGDIISKVDGVEYTGEQMTEAANKIKGEVGTTVKLGIIRGTESLELEIKRENIKINHVESKTLDNNIGYLKLSTFDEGCADEFKQKYDELNANKNIKALVVDLRNNGGGLVEEALNIADYFTDKDSKLLITVDKKEKEEIRKAKQSKYINVPVVVLINENTASASEILAGALRDNGIAKIVGTKSYGKGVIQEVLTLQDGTGIKITTNEYFTPNKTKINKVGIEPDETVNLPETVKNVLTVEEKDDTQLQKAEEILK